MSTTDANDLPEYGDEEELVGSPTAAVGTISAADLLDEFADEIAEDLPESSLRLNPTVYAGQLNSYSDYLPVWEGEDKGDLEARPTRMIPITAVLDLRKATITLARFSYYKQRKREVVNAGTPIEQARDPEDFNYQSELDIFIHVPNPMTDFMVYTRIDTNPNPKSYDVEMDGYWLRPHPMYLRDKFSSMRARALVAYARTPFNPSHTMVETMKNTLLGAGFVPVGREDRPDTKRYTEFNIQAPCDASASVQVRQRQQQETGFRLDSFTLLAPRPLDQRGEFSDRLEFEGFTYHLVENMRWAQALASVTDASGEAAYTRQQIFSLSTSITGVDYKGQDRAQRPRGNALRATMQSVGFTAPIPDDQVRKIVDVPEGIPVTAKFREFALRLQPELAQATTLNFFGGSSGGTAPSIEEP